MKLLDQIEQGAVDDAVPIGTLLRKCLVLAHRLNSKPATDWVERELNGYGPDDELPDYRKLRVLVKAHIINDHIQHPNWLVPPAILGKHADSCSKSDWRQSIAATESLLGDRKDASPICLNMGDLVLILSKNEAIVGEVLSAWGEISGGKSQTFWRPCEIVC
jgi:hypothetical protein